MVVSTRRSAAGASCMEAAMACPCPGPLAALPFDLQIRCLDAAFESHGAGLEPQWLAPSSGCPAGSAKWAVGAWHLHAPQRTARAIVNLMLVCRAWHRIGARHEIALRCLRRGQLLVR
jgi:hypothetical protein